MPAPAVERRNLPKEAARIVDKKIAHTYELLFIRLFEGVTFAAAQRRAIQRSGSLRWRTGREDIVAMKSLVRRDVLDRFPTLAIGLLFVSFVIFAGVFAYFDSYEEFYEFTRKYEHWELDEIIMAFFMVLTFFAPIFLLLSHKVLTRNVALTESRNMVRAELEHKRFMEKTRHDMVGRLSEDLKGKLRASLSALDLATQIESGDLERMVDEIVTVCKMGADRPGDGGEDIDFIDLVDESRSDLKRNAHRLDAEVIFEIDEKFPRHLYGDKYVVSQLVSELLHDAVMRSRFGSVYVKFRHGSAGKQKKKIFIEVRNLGDPVDTHLQRLCADTPSVSYLRTHRTFDPDNHFLMCYWLTHALGGMINVRPHPGGSIVAVAFTLSTNRE